MNLIRNKGNFWRARREWSGASGDHEGGTRLWLHTIQPLPARTKTRCRIQSPQGLIQGSWSL